MTNFGREVVIKESTYSNFTGYTGNKAKIIRKLEDVHYPNEYEVVFSNGMKEMFRMDELEFVIN